ncbi:ATP-binding protein [Phormidium nigroviride]
MTSIEQIIQREVNPFDPVTFYTGNFWQEQQNSELIVESIHTEAIDKIIKYLDIVSRDHQTRTLLLCGDRGSGKSYLLARLKHQLNSKAFFAYIGPWAESDHIYRHILRQTVDSLIQIPEGAKESQLLLWLKSRSAFKDRSLMKRVFGERQVFISNFKATYPVGISNPDKFFRVLYSLTNPELYDIACQWLRGDDLDEENLKALGLNKSIETETDAYNILANFGRISSETQPIVLCFDQIDKKAIPPNGYRGLQPLFSVNTTIHNEKLKNFLIIISLVTNTWRQNEKQILEADKDRLTGGIFLKYITLDQGESIWQKRLFPLHQQATPKPKSPIEPLSRQALEEKFPGGKTNPRYILQLGQQLIQEYKTGTNTPPDSIAAFQLVWLKAFKKTQTKYSKISQISDIDLMAMLQENLAALEVKGIKTKLLSSPTFASSSLSYQAPNQKIRVGVVWAEFLNMNGFSSLMKACQKAINDNLCQSLYLIRAAEIGKPTNQGYKIHTKIFTASSHHHIKPKLDSVWYLATYHSLVNAACAGELVVGYQTPNLSELEALIRESKVLDDCQLLQDLGIIQTKEKDPISPAGKIDLNPVKNFLLNLVTTQFHMGLLTLINNACSQFPQVNQSQVEQLIDELCQENKILIHDPNAKLEEQLIFLVPKS